MEYEKIIDTLKGEEVIVYERRNNKIEKISEFADVVFSAIEKREPLFTFISGENETGKMINEVYVFKNFMVIRSSWNPRPPYSWDEETIRLVKFKY